MRYFLALVMALTILPSVSFAEKKGANMRCGGGCPVFYIAPRVSFGKLSVTDPSGGPVVDFVSDTSLGFETSLELLGGSALSVFAQYSLDKISYVPPTGRLMDPPSGIQHTFRLLAYFKEMGGRFFLGAGGEYRRAYFLDRVAGTTYHFDNRFIPSLVGQLLIRLWGGGKGGPPCFLKLEALYRLAIQSTSLTVDGGLDFGGEFFYTIPGGKIDFRIGIRGALENYPAAIRNQTNMVLSGIVALVLP